MLETSSCFVSLRVDVVMHILWCDRLHGSEEELQNYNIPVFKLFEHGTVLPLCETVRLLQDATTNLHGECDVQQKYSVHLHSEQRGTCSDASKR